MVLHKALFDLGVSGDDSTPERRLFFGFGWGLIGRVTSDHAGVQRPKRQRSPLSHQESDAKA